MTDTPRNDTRIALEWLYQAVSEGITDANYAAVTNAAQVLDLPASLPSPPVSGEAAGYMLIYPGCECGPTETCESVAYQKLAESPPGTELRPVYFHPPLTNEPVGVTAELTEAAKALSFAVEVADELNKNGGKDGKRVKVKDAITDMELRELNSRLYAAIGERG